METRSSENAAPLSGRAEANASLSLFEELARCPVTSAAQLRIESAHHCRLQHVRCEHRNGVLTLTGTVPTFYHKQIAQECVRVVPGVTRIVNMLDVVWESNPR